MDVEAVPGDAGGIVELDLAGLGQVIHQGAGQQGVLEGDLARVAGTQDMDWTRSGRSCSHTAL